jgi:hypothetical protein
MDDEKDRNELKEKILKADQLAAGGDNFSAAFYYKEALGLARKLNDAAAIRECKKKMVTANQNSDSQFKELSVEQEIPKEAMEVINKSIASILGAGDLEKVLISVGRHPELYPHFDGVEKNTQKTMPITYRVATLSTISEKGHLVEGGADPTRHWFAQMYGISQGIINQLYLGKIFDGLEKMGLNADTLYAHLKNSKIFPENFLKLIPAGLERYFEKDYVSAMHIFIPQFENAFIFISERMGLDIIALNRTAELSTNTKALSMAHLTSEPFEKAWGKNFCQQVSFILFDPLGYKLRHKLAHGEIAAEECNRTNSSLMIYLFLVLAARVKTIKENSPENVEKV